MLGFNAKTLKSVGSRQAGTKFNRLPTLDALRGVASLAVMWFHFTRYLSAHLSGNLIYLSGKYGWLGVSVFFVISGFVIPLAMVRANFVVSDYGRFLLKRITRLDPPYLLSILLIIAYEYLLTTRPSYQGIPFHLSTPQILLHVGYLNAFFGYEWLNGVFWSLAIEFQYYILIGLLFPVLLSRRSYVRLASMFALAGLAFVFRDGALIIPYLPLFLLGIATLHKYLGLLSPLAYMVVAVLLTLIMIPILGADTAATGVTTAMLVAYVKIESRVLAFFGLISYSLYLLHTPVGLALLGMVMSHLDNPYWSLLLTVAVIIPVATIYYWLVERPSQMLSARFSYKRQKIPGHPAEGGSLAESPSISALIQEA